MRTALFSLALFCGATIFLFVLQLFLDGSTSNEFFYWALPFFHKFFPPLSSGPSPLAGVWCLILNAVLLAGGIVSAWLWLRRHHA